MLYLKHSRKNIINPKPNNLQNNNNHFEMI